MSSGYQRTTRDATGAGSADRDLENFYQLLGVPYTASAAEITRAYRTAIKRAHPDRVVPERRAAAEDIAKDLNRAYRTLSNPTERLAYDRQIRPQVLQDELMQRYIGGFSGQGVGREDPFGQRLKRKPTQAERADVRRSERSALITLVSIFLVVTLGVIGLLLIWSLLTYVVDVLL